MLQITYCRSARSLKSMPMHRLLCCEEKVGLPNDATAREGAKAKARGADRTTIAAEATVTNESLMFFVQILKVMR